MKHYSLVKGNIGDEDIPIAIVGGKTMIALHPSDKKYGTREISCSDIEPLPYVQKDQNFRMYMAGASGCGKSFLCSILIKNYLKLYPNQSVFIMSILEHDKSIDDNKAIGNKINRINLEEVDDIDDFKMFNNSLVIFDDFTGLKQSQQKKVNALKDQLLKAARHIGTDVVTTNDKLLAGYTSIKDLLQSQFIGLFPTTGLNKNEVVSFLKNRMCLEQNQINRILHSDSRYVIVHKSWPAYVITENELYML